MGILKDLVEDIQKANPYFDYRQSQDEGSETVFNMVQSDNGGVVILEGPCGFGKTYAYLIPVIKNKIKDSDERIIIVTDGIALQEQLYERDIPNVLEILGKNYLKVALLKGRNNYLCPATYAEASMMTGGIGLSSFNPESKRQLEEMEKWAESTKTGDISELSFIPEKDLASKFILLDGDDCPGRKCGLYQDCFYYKNRNDAVEKADIIITNYHYLFTAMSSRGMLPEGKITYVFDEAHAIVDIYRDFTERKITYNSLSRMIRKIGSLNKNSETYKIIFRVASDLPLRLEETLSSGKIFFEKLNKELCQSKERVALLEDAVLNLKLKGLIQELIKYIADSFGIFDEIIESVENSISELNSASISTKEQKDVQKVKSGISSLKDLISMSRTLMEVIDNPSDKMCYWVEGNEETGLSEIHSKKIDVGSDINEKFFINKEKEFEVIPPRIILTSATLSVGKDFSFIKKQLGINSTVETYEFIGESPFNLTNQQLWYLPEDAVAGSDQKFIEYSTKAVRRIIDATRGGALCLFTSLYNLRKAYESINKRAVDYSVLRQGDAPKSQLLRLFSNETDSVLMATKSFFTGVDVPGPSLRCVIIDKLPFAIQGDPVVRKITKSKTAFYDYSIPNMVINLKQAVGRGVRGKDDKCVIAILDNRMSTANYAKTINLSFFYKKTGTRNLDDVKAFVDDYLKEAVPIKVSTNLRFNDEIIGVDEGDDFPFSFDDIPW